MIPPLPLEHLEHRDVFFVERVAFDQLKVLRLKSPLSRSGDFFRSEPILDLRHSGNIGDSARKVTNFNRLALLHPLYITPSAAP